MTNIAQKIIFLTSLISCNSEKGKAQDTPVKSEENHDINTDLKEGSRCLNSLKKSLDEEDNVIWYKQPSITYSNNSNLASIYIGDNGKNRWLRLVISNTENTEILFNKVLLKYDEIVVEVIFDSKEDYTIKKNKAQVSEWIDVTVNDNLQRFLREFSESENAEVQLSGTSTKTRKLSAEEKTGINEVLIAYDFLQDEYSRNVKKAFDFQIFKK
jgi:hypothetical protein